MQVGEIHRHQAFYADRETGELKAKYFLVLARIPGGDVVTRLLTSRANGRPEIPPCFHGDPYPGFYLGVIGEPLTAKSWLDLRHLPDMDETEVAGRIRKGIVRHVAVLADDLMHAALKCVAGANDTTRQQERAIRDQMARMGEGRVPGRD